MMPTPIFQIDAFSQRCFGGNPAAVIPLQHWPDDALMQAIAEENQLSETAFFVPNQTGYQLRWFTPLAEVELCGHATLASAWCLFHLLGHTADSIRFSTRSGPLMAHREESMIRISLPSRPSEAASAERLALVNLALKAEAQSLRSGANLMAIFAEAAQIRHLQPDFQALTAFHPQGLIVTAPGQDCDFVSRYFAPSFGVNEDPVTGSAHADLAPYWAARLNKNELHARQLSRRGGELRIRQRQGETHLLGSCSLYLRGTIEVDGLHPLQDLAPLI